MVKLEVEFEGPKSPNYLRASNGVLVDVADLSDETLELVGREFTRDLIQNARNRRNKRD